MKKSYIIYVILLTLLCSCCQNNVQRVKVNQVECDKSTAREHSEYILEQYISADNHDVTAESSIRYSDSEMKEIEEFTGGFLERIKQYPFSALRRLTYYYPLFKTALPYTNADYETTVDTYIATYIGERTIHFILYDYKGMELSSWSQELSPHSIFFERIFIDDDLNTMMNLDPAGDYFGTSGRTDLPKLSTHYTRDGYIIIVCYDDSYKVNSIYKYLM